jgi:hypothetical protein
MNMLETVNKQSAIILGTKQPHKSIQNVRNSTKLNVFFKAEVYGRFSFSERAVSRDNNPEKLRNWPMPQLE